jgi:hypothetical protein
MSHLRVPVHSEKGRLEERLKRLEKQAGHANTDPVPVMQVTSVPTEAARDGTIAVNSSTNEVYFRIGGAWRKVTTTAA